MAAIITFIGSIFSSIFGYLGVHAARKVTLMALYISLYVALVVAFTLGINGFLASVVVAFPSESFVIAGMSLIPPNATQCITAIGLAHAASWVFIFKTKLLAIKMRS